MRKNKTRRRIAKIIKHVRTLFLVSRRFHAMRASANAIVGKKPSERRSTMVGEEDKFSAFELK
jgi:hypothetical protein